MRVFRIVKTGRPVTEGPWASKFRGQTADDLYSVVRGKGSLAYWLNIAYAETGAEAVDVYELGINPRSVVSTRHNGELLIAEETLKNAKVLRVKRVHAMDFIRERRIGHGLSGNIVDWLQDSESIYKHYAGSDKTKMTMDLSYRMAVENIKKKLGPDADPWVVAKLAHELLRIPVKNNK